MGEIHRAFYGERGGGHDLLAASTPNLPAVRGVLGATDRPSANGGEWSPYVSGLRMGDHFVLMRTFPAPGRTGGRGGFVFTDALFIEQEDVASISDLRLLLKLLSAHPYQNPPRPEPIPSPEPGAPPVFPSDRRARAAARQILTPRGPGRPVVWLGQEGFEDLLARVWAGLWPAARMELRFRASFDPTDVERGALTLVCTPQRSRARWVGFAVVEPVDSVDDPTPAESLLSGESSPLANFVTRFGLRSPSPHALRQAEAAADLLHKIESLAPDLQVRLVRLLVVLGPEVTAAFDAKALVIERVAQAVHSANAGFVHSLRNLPQASLGDTLSPLRRALHDWTRMNLLGHSTRIGEWMQDEAEPWWTEALRTGVESAVREWSHGMAPALWNVWIAVPEEVEALSALAAGHVAWEHDLASTCPLTLGSVVAQAVMDTARIHDWRVLFGLADAAAHGPAKAVDRLVDVFAGDIEETLHALARRYGAGFLIDAAVATHELRLTDAAAMWATRQPGLLANLEWNDEGWRSLWLRSIQLGADPWGGIPEPLATRDRLLDRMLDVHDVDPTLLNALAGTRLADLAGHPRRQELWNVLPEPAATRFLRATASAWVERFRAFPETEPVPEPPVLSLALREPRLLAVDGIDPVRSLHTAILAFERIPGLEETDFLTWLGRVRPVLSRVSPADAARIGRIVAMNSWRAAASKLNSYRKTGTGLSAAIPHVWHLLGIFERFIGGLEGLNHGPHPTPEWYDVLLELAVSLYPQGPEQGRIWERGGGDPSRIEGASGRDRWRSAISLLRSGGAGRNAKPKSLTYEMRNDYTHNAELRVLHDTAP